MRALGLLLDIVDQIWKSFRRAGGGKEDTPAQSRETAAKSVESGREWLRALWLALLACSRGGGVGLTEEQRALLEQQRAVALKRAAHDLEDGLDAASDAAQARIMEAASTVEKRLKAVSLKMQTRFAKALAVPLPWMCSTRCFMFAAYIEEAWKAMRAGMSV